MPTLVTHRGRRGLNHHGHPRQASSPVQAHPRRPRTSASKPFTKPTPTIRRRSRRSPRTMPTRACGARRWSASSTPSVLSDIVRNESDAARQGRCAWRSSWNAPASTRPARRRPRSPRSSRSAASASWPCWPRAPGPSPSVARRVEALSDPKLLGSVARHAAEAGVRLLAVEPPDRCRPNSKAWRCAASTRMPRWRRSTRFRRRRSTCSPASRQKARTKAAQKRARALARPLEPAAAASGPSPPSATRKPIRSARASSSAQMTALAARPTSPRAA